MAFDTLLAEKKQVKDSAWQNRGSSIFGILFDLGLRVILFFGFYLIVTPTGLMLRILGRDYLSRKIDNETDSYWVSR